MTMTTEPIKINQPAQAKTRTPQRVGPTAGEEDVELRIARRVAEVRKDEPLPPRRVRLGLQLVGRWVGRSDNVIKLGNVLFST